jgi:hypothetical protein
LFAAGLGHGVTSVTSILFKGLRVQGLGLKISGISSFFMFSVSAAYCSSTHWLHFNYFCIFDGSKIIEELPIYQIF